LFFLKNFFFQNIIFKDYDSEISKKELPLELSHLFTLENVKKMIEEHYRGRNLMTEISITLPGSPQIIISSNSKDPFLVPWKIQYCYLNSQQKSFITYSTELSKIIMKIFGNSFTFSVRDLLNPSEHVWKCLFWKDIEEIRKAYSFWITDRKEKKN